MGSTITVEESVGIARAPADVWEAIADYGFDAQWRAGLREMSPDPPGGPAIGTAAGVRQECRRGRTAAHRAPTPAAPAGAL